MARSGKKASQRKTAGDRTKRLLSASPECSEPRPCSPELLQSGSNNQATQTTSDSRSSSSVHSVAGPSVPKVSDTEDITASPACVCASGAPAEAFQRVNVTKDSALDQKDASLASSSAVDRDKYASCRGCSACAEARAAGVGEPNCFLCFLKAASSQSDKIRLRRLRYWAAHNEVEHAAVVSLLELLRRCGFFPSLRSAKRTP